MAIPIAALIAAGGSGLNFLGGLLGNRAQNKQREDILNMSKEALEYLRSQGIANPEQILQQAIGPLLEYSNGVLDWSPSNNLDYQFAQQAALFDYLQNQAPKISAPGDLQRYFQSPLADVGRGLNEVLNFQRPAMYQTMNDPAYGIIRDRLGDMANGQDQALAALLAGGNDLLDYKGTTADNMPALQRAGEAMSRGGYTGQGQSIFDAGNALFSTGGMNPQLQSIFNQATRLSNANGMTPELGGLYGAGQGVVGGGGYTPGLSQMAGGYGQIPSYLNGGANAATAASVLGPGGQQIIQELMNPISSGYNAQNMAVSNLGFEGMLDLLARNPQLDQASAYGQQMFSGNLPGEDVYGGKIDSLINQLISNAGSVGGLSVGGGGGASGASAGSLIAMDPRLEEMLAKGAELFGKDALIPMSQRISMAVDEAATSSAQAAEAAQRYAAARGGGGALVGGAQNRAMAEFRDQAMRGRAEALRNAILDQQQLQLQQRLQGGQVGVAASNADTNRQQVAASRDIATANNATQASVANAQMAQAAANQNAQLQLAAAQMRNAALSQGANVALGARGQNYDRSAAGMQAMLAAQELANQRGGLFNTAMLGGMQDATTRYGTDAQKQIAALNATVGAGNAAVGQNTALAQLMGQLALGAQQQATTRQGQGFDAMSNAAGIGSQNLIAALNAGLGVTGQANSNVLNGLNTMLGANQQANNALDIWSRIQGQNQQDQLQRVLAGANMLNQNVGTRLTGLHTLGNAMNNQYNNAIGMGNLFNQTQKSQSDIWRDMFNMDFGNRQLEAQINNDWFRNALGIGAQGQNITQMALTPLQQLQNGMIGYQGQALGQYGQVIGGMQRFLTPQQQNPWPQVSINPASYGLGGGASGGGYMGAPNIPLNLPGMPGYSGAPLPSGNVFNVPGPFIGGGY